MKHKAAGINLYADGDIIKLVSSDPIALSSNFKLTTISGIEEENFADFH